MVSMAIMVASFRTSLDAWLERILPADMYVRAGATGDTAYMGPDDQSRCSIPPGLRLSWSRAISTRPLCQGNSSWSGTF